MKKIIKYTRMKKFFLFFVMAMMMAVTANAQYGLRAITGVPVVIDSMRTNIAAHPETFVIGFEGYESGDLWFGTPVVEYGADLCRVTAKLNLYTAVTSSYLCLLEVQSYAFGGQFGGHVTMYAQELDSISGRVLHSDSLVVPFYGLILGPEPEPEPEFVVPSYIQMPDEYAYFYTERDSMTNFPVCRLEGGTRNCLVEWGWVENYALQYSASGAPMSSSDITKPTMVYHVLKEDTTYTVESDPTSTMYQPILKLKSEFDVRPYYNVSLDEFFYCRVYQNDSLLREAVFIYMNEMQVRSLWISMDGLYNGAYDGDSVPHRAAMEIDGPGQTGEAYIEWYNVLDTAEMYPADVFRNGNSYYAKVMTPFDSLFMPGYVLNERTSIYWGGVWNGDKSDNHYDNSGVLRSPAVSVDDVVWEVNIRLENGGYFIRSRVDIHRDSLVVDTVRLEMATDVLDWMPLMGEELYIDRNGISGFLPALAFRAGTYYFRFVAEAGGRDYVSQVYTIVIGGGINIDLESVTEGTVEYDAEFKTVTISGVVIENVEIALTNMEDGATIALDGTTTITADSTGILTSADVVIEGSYGAEFTSTDTTTIVAAHPIAASAEGVKLVLDGVTLHLVVVRSAAASVPGRDAARRQMSPMMRARYIAHTVLLTADAEDESVISGFDEVDFINCGVIEPEGAEYDEDDLQLENNGEPVYNCTIVPMETPMPEAIQSVEAEKVSTDKQLRQGAIYILRQNRVYTVMGQLVK